HLGARRPQLPDRTPSLPARAAHPLPAHRTDRQQELHTLRSEVLIAAVAASRSPLARTPPTPHGPARAAGRARDGLSATTHPDAIAPGRRSGALLNGGRSAHAGRNRRPAKVVLEHVPDTCPAP